MTKKEAVHVLKNCFALEPEIAQAAEIVLEESEEWEMQLKELQCEVEDYKTAIKDWEAKFEKAEYEWGVKAELNYRQGIINGLKYAIRCNGISGGDIHE